MLEFLKTRTYHTEKDLETLSNSIESEMTYDEFYKCNITDGVTEKIIKKESDDILYKNSFRPYVKIKYIQDENAENGNNIKVKCSLPKSVIIFSVLYCVIMTVFQMMFLLANMKNFVIRFVPLYMIMIGAVIILAGIIVCSRNFLTHFEELI